MKNLDRLRNYRNNSFYNRSCYEVCVPLDNFKNMIMSYGVPLEDKREFGRKEEQVSTKEFFDLMIPGFQRDNDKWTTDMQIKFIENLFSGIDSIIMLGLVEKEENQGCYCDSRIVDGFQRITAVIDYLEGKFPIFEDIYYTKEEETFLRGVMNMKVRIYKFKSEEEMVRFYIQMNENITHSKEDILKAKKYLSTKTSK